MIRKIQSIVLFALMLTACGESTNVEVDNGVEQSVSFSILPSIGETLQAEITTRAKVDGTFASGAQIGLGIRSVISGSTPVSTVYSHFFSRFNGTDWLYYLGGVSNGTRLSGFAGWGTIEVCGYYPYNSAVTNPAQVPFRIASIEAGVAKAIDVEAQVDYMVAEPQSKDMTLGTNQPVALAFDHLMTSIELRIRRQYNSLPSLKLEKVVFEINASRTFTVEGMYNAQTPDMSNMSNNITPLVTSNRMEITYPNSTNITSDEYSNRLLVILPEIRLTTEADDATLTLTFSFTERDGTPYVFEDNAPNPSLSFALSSVDNGTGNDKGLLSGRTYRIQAILGTYTKFTAPTGPTVVDAPLDENTTPEFIDI